VIKENKQIDCKYLNSIDNYLFVYFYSNPLTIAILNYAVFALLMIANVFQYLLVRERYRKNFKSNCPLFLITIVYALSFLYRAIGDTY
jgi:hypothetical protein